MTVEQRRPRVRNAAHYAAIGNPLPVIFRWAFKRDDVRIVKRRDAPFTAPLDKDTGNHTPPFRCLPSPN
jgi:hypothetical protein